MREPITAEMERNLRRTHWRLHPEGVTKTGRVCLVCQLLERLLYERAERQALADKLEHAERELAGEWPYNDEELVL